MVDVSVIVPIYNVEKYLKRCLESIINQTFKNIEIILVNDGSKDNSPKICEEYKEKDKRIKVIHKQNQGLGYARNSGLEVAKGKYIFFVDSDDYIDLEMIEKMYYKINKNSSDICFSDFYRVNGNKIVKNNHITDELVGVYKGEEINKIIIPNLIGGLPNNQNDDVLGWGVWKVLYKKEIIDTNNIKFHSEREMISEDIIFQLDYLKFVNNATIMKEAYYYYCINEGSLSKSYKEDRLEKNKILYFEQKKRLEDLKAYEYSKLRLERLFLASLRMEIMINAKQLKFFKCRKSIKKIMNDELVIKILKEFPIKKLPIKQRIFNYLLRYKLNLGTYIFTKLYIKYKSY